MKKITAFIFIAVLLLVSCKGSTKYSVTTEDFPDNRWNTGEAKELEFSIDKDQEADVYILFGYKYGTQFTDVPVKLEITAPDGSITLLTSELKLTDEAGKSLGDCAGDVCDLAVLAKKGLKLQKGDYTFKVINNFTKASYLPNVLSVGIKLEHMLGKE
ncbi:gliding motility lipoprotein GldH family protein [Flavobacterium rhizosphaerae]|uniref:Gliding motility-associated lipoprotein GldH n=1 Tax=Flavobacterium rhizosphaerae TaxID=3163298 RepID=A0ABW8YXC2_9FLAO